MLMTTIFAHEMGRSTRCHEKRKAFLCRGDFATRIPASQRESSVLRRHHEHLQTQRPLAQRRRLVNSNKKVPPCCRIWSARVDYRMNNLASSRIAVPRR
jgi:hypothetical protein